MISPVLRDYKPMISPVLRDYKHDMAIAIRYNSTYSRKAALLFYRARMLGKAYKVVKASSAEVYRSGSHKDCMDMVGMCSVLSLQVAELRREARQLLKEGEKEINTVRFEYSTC